METTSIPASTFRCVIIFPARKTEPSLATRPDGGSLSSRKRWPDDHALIGACRKGDESAWDTLIRRYQRLIYSIPVAYGFAAGDADEIFQRVALKLFENLGRVKKIEALTSWLVVTTRRECQTFRRGAGRWRSLEEVDPGSMSEDPPDVAEALHALEAEHTLAQAFERLDETCRVLLAALYLEDPTPSYQEIGRRLDRSVGSLGPTRARCLKKLQTVFVRLGGQKP